MEEVAISSKLELHGAAASSSPHSVLNLPNLHPSSSSSSSESSKESILYASNCILNIATPVRLDDDSVAYNVESTLRTCTLPRSDVLRSITAMALLNPIDDVVGGTERECTGTGEGIGVSSMVVCAFSDGTITLWIRRNDNDNDNSWSEHVITGLTADGEVGVVTITDPNTNKGTNANAQHSHSHFETSIADIDGVYCQHNALAPDGSASASASGSLNIDVIIVTASSNGLQSYTRCIEIQNSSANANANVNMKTNTEMTIIGTYPTFTIKFTTMDNQLLLAVGTALPRNNRIHFYTCPIPIRSPSASSSSSSSSTMSILWKHQGSVMGHLDWISCLDWSWCWSFNGDGNNNTVECAGANADAGADAGVNIGVSTGTGMLASGSQDARIRLWKFHPVTIYEDDDNSGEDSEDDDDEGEDEEDEDDENLIEEGEARMYLRYENGDGVIVQSAVTLEALLIGHEEHVTSVGWRPGSVKPCLISSSMDRSILIWMEEDEQEQSESAAAVMSMSEGSGNVWVPVTRVGTAGGVLGGSVGSSLLGFVNVLWSNDGKRILGHGFGGAIYFWSSHHTHDQSEHASTSIERWVATSGITGHFRGCSDISWEATEGMYLLSGGLDQTCRLWMQVPTHQDNLQNSKIWKEVGRPQVHGYDLNTVACIGTGKGELLHRFVSGADEKEARAFDAPIDTMKLIQRLRGDDVDKVDALNNGVRVERAFIPSLGLSNRANISDAMEEGSEVGIPKDSKDGGVHVDEQSVAKALPRERDLGVVSLWPEIRKLYGHLTEMICLASTAGRCKGKASEQDEVLVASSCIARDSENAAIRVWNVEKNICVDILKVRTHE